MSHPGSIPLNAMSLAMMKYEQVADDPSYAYIRCMSDLLSKLAEHAAFTHVANNFGHYCAIARRKPVAVTSQGRASIVIIAAEEFERLAALDAPVALYAHELPDNIATALQADDIPAAAEDFNGEYTPR